MQVANREGKMLFTFFAVASLFEIEFLAPFIIVSIMLRQPEMTPLCIYGLVVASALALYVGAGREVLPSIALCAAGTFAADDEPFKKVLASWTDKVMSRIVG